MDFLIPNKLHSPYRTAYIEREHLSDRILSNLERKLTLISAPAGFGKTYLALEVSAKVEHRVKWYVLDENDASLKTFLTYLEATLFAEDNAGVLTTNMSLEEAAATVSKRLYDEQVPTLLILDGFHYVDNSKVVEFIERLLAYLPPICHILLTSRTQTSLNLAKMLVRQEVSVINERDLAFSAAEVERLACKVEVSSESEEIFTRTKGWPAAVSLSLSTGLQVHSEGVIYDYIRGELFDGLDAEEEQTAYLVALAPSLSMREISALELDIAVLKKLEREHRLLTTDGSAYAFQPLLREGVLEYLKNDQLPVWTELNRQLGNTLWENGFNEGLICLAEAGSSYLAEALKSINFNILPGDVWQSLTPWLNSLSETDLETMPLMMVLKADSLIFKDPNKALAYYEDALTSDLAGEARATALVGRLRAVEKVPDEQLRLEPLAKETQEELEKINNPYQLARAKIVLAGVYNKQTRYLEAEALYLEVESIAKNLEDTYIEQLAIYGLSRLHATRGYAMQSLQYGQRILDYRKSKGHPFGEAIASYMVASSYLMLGDADTSLIYIEDAIRLFNTIESKLHLPACLYLLLSIKAALGETTAAEQIFTEFEGYTSEKESLLANYVYLVKAQLHITSLEPNKAQHLINLVESSSKESKSSILQGKLCFTKGLLKIQNKGNEEAKNLISESIQVLRAAGDKSEEVLASKIMLNLTNDKKIRTELSEQIKEMEKELGYEVPLYTLSNLIRDSSYSKTKLQVVPSLVVKTLGCLQISIDTAVIPHKAWNGKKPKELFLLLAGLRNGTSRDFLIEAIWKEDELKDPEQQFSIALSRARRALGGRHTILRTGIQYELSGFRLDYDALNLLETDISASDQDIHAALESYKGVYLEGYYSNWVAERRNKIEEKFLTLTSELINRTKMKKRDIHRLVRQAATIDPTNTEFNSFLIKFYMTSDKRLLARMQFETYAKHMRELGISPDSRLKGLLA